MPLACFTTTVMPSRKTIFSLVRSYGKPKRNVIRGKPAHFMIKLDLKNLTLAPMAPIEFDDSDTIYMPDLAEA